MLALQPHHERLVAILHVAHHPLAPKHRPAGVFPLLDQGQGRVARTTTRPCCLQPHKQQPLLNGRLVARHTRAAAGACCRLCSGLIQLRDASAAAALIKGPTMVGAHELAVQQSALRQRREAVWACVLKCTPAAG